MPDYPDDADGRVLADLAATGVDMSRPVLIEFAVAAPDQQSAEAIERALAGQGYQAQAEYDEGEPDDAGEIDPEDEEFGPSWTVYVDVEMVPAYEQVVRVQAELDRIAAPLGGKSDGWGVMLD